MTTIERVSGPSALGLFRASRIVFAAVLTPLVVAGLTLLALGLKPWGVTVTVIACAVAGVCLLLGFVFSPIQEHREFVSGYTTFGAVHRELPQVAPGTTFVIRAAGDDYLPWAEQVRLSAQAGESSR